MATKQTRNAPSAPIELTQVQVNMARKGQSVRVFEKIEKAPAAKKKKSKAKSRTRKRA